MFWVGPDCRRVGNVFHVWIGAYWYFRTFCVVVPLNLAFVLLTIACEPVFCGCTLYTFWGLFGLLFSSLFWLLCLALWVWIVGYLVCRGSSS